MTAGRPPTRQEGMSLLSPGLALPCGALTFGYFPEGNVCESYPKLTSDPPLLPAPCGSEGQLNSASGLFIQHFSCDVFRTISLGELARTNH